jgi:hypothetical protein
VLACQLFGRVLCQKDMLGLFMRVELFFDYKSIISFSADNSIPVWTSTVYAFQGST